jgi:RNA polymerase sigma factor (sigma-70 family)
MSDRHVSKVVQHLRQVVLAHGADWTDAQLLQRFLAQRDEAAFAALLRRHGPLVLGVCRRVLGNAADADDAFQATFLVLVRKAPTLRPHTPLGNWLYGVAYRTALKARAKAARRRFKEQQVKPRQPPAAEPAAAWHDVRPLLDQELSRLPDKYRVPVVLCDLEGKTRKEAAGQLRLPEGTVSSRLATARRMLARRLTRRGVTLSGGTLAVTLAESAVVAVPPALADAAVRTATLFLGGPSLGTISANILLLTEEVMKSLLLSKLKIASAVVLLAALLGVGAGNWLYPASAGQVGPPGGEGVAVARKAKAGKPGDGVKRAGKALQGTVDVNFDEVPLADVVNHLRELSQVNLILDRAVLKAAGIDFATPISLRLRKVPFKTVLKHVLAQSGLGYTFEDDILTITSAEAARDKMVRKVYPVADLVGDGEGGPVPAGQFGVPIGMGPGGPGLGALGALGGGQGGAVPGGGGGVFGQMGGGALGALGGAAGQFGGGMGFQGGMGGGQQWLSAGEHQFIQVITRTVGPSTWSETGGPGTIAYLPAAGCLVVSQSSEIQDQIQALIEELRVAKKRQDEERSKKAAETGAG